MPRNRSPSADPDFFSIRSLRNILAPLTDQVGETKAVPLPRHVLPANLPEAIKYIDDEDLERLLAAVLAEQRRRGKKHFVAGRTSNKQPVKASANPLTVGKLNAVRAAFKAGVRPSQIARQFGISPSDVRNALASEEAKHRF
jgi:hypothetical protein